MYHLLAVRVFTKEHIQIKNKLETNNIRRKYIIILLNTKERIKNGALHLESRDYTK